MGAFPKQMLADLKRSGLGPKEAKALGLEFSSTDGRPCYAIPYHDLDGKPTQHFRGRYLGVPHELPKDAKSGRPQRYHQPKGSAPRFYYPHLGRVSWRKTARDAAVPLYITEGEKKAASLCRLGVPCVGLGGVF